MTWSHFPASKLTTLKQCSFPIYTRFQPIISTAHPAGKKRSSLHMVSMVLMCFCPKQTDVDEAMHVDAIIRLWHGQKFPYTHMQSHTHCEHPVYLARPLLIGCGISAHYWQLGIFPVERAFPMTNIQTATGTHVCPWCPYKAAQCLQVHSMLRAWVLLGRHRGAPVTFRGCMR